MTNEQMREKIDWIRTHRGGDGYLCDVLEGLLARRTSTQERGEAGQAQDETASRRRWETSSNRVLHVMQGLKLLCGGSGGWLTVGGELPTCPACLSKLREQPGKTRGELVAREWKASPLGYHMTEPELAKLIDAEFSRQRADIDARVRAIPQPEHVGHAWVEGWNVMRERVVGVIGSE